MNPEDIGMGMKSGVVVCLLELTDSSSSTNVEHLPERMVLDDERADKDEWVGPCSEDMIGRLSIPFKRFKPHITRVYFKNAVLLTVFLFPEKNAFFGALFSAPEQKDLLFPIRSLDLRHSPFPVSCS